MEKKEVIVYDSATGNTKFLAEQLAAALPGVPCGPVGAADVSGADLVFLGFWTDKGSCSEALRAFLPALAGKRVFLFGTAGFGGSPEYFGQIITRVSSLLPGSCTVEDWFMCQGRMGEAVRRRYEAMAADPASAEKGKALLENFERASAHPDQKDVEALAAKAAGCLRAP